jgi:hypothetical protein
MWIKAIVAQMWWSRISLNEVRKIMEISVMRVGVPARILFRQLAFAASQLAETLTVVQRAEYTTIYYLPLNL